LLRLLNNSRIVISKNWNFRFAHPLSSIIMSTIWGAGLLLKYHTKRFSKYSLSNKKLIKNELEEICTSMSREHIFMLQTYQKSYSLQYFGTFLFLLLGRPRFDLYTTRKPLPRNNVCENTLRSNCIAQLCGFVNII
jgi:hypothetical protein